jgi:hypothetical protein
MGKVMSWTWKVVKATYRVFRPICSQFLKLAVMALPLMLSIPVSVLAGLMPLIDQTSTKIEEALANYVPTGLHTALHRFSKVTGILVIIIGLLVWSHVTVWAWRWLWSLL